MSDSNVVTLKGERVPPANSRVELAAWLREVAGWLDKGEDKYADVCELVIVFGSHSGNPFIKANGPSDMSTMKTVGLIEIAKFCTIEEGW